MHTRFQRKQIYDRGQVMAHWRKHYLSLIAKQPAGAPTALRVTTRWAQAEVAYAAEHGTSPRPGSPPH